MAKQIPALQILPSLSAVIMKAVNRLKLKCLIVTLNLL